MDCVRSEMTDRVLVKVQISYKNTSDVCFPMKGFTLSTSLLSTFLLFTLVSALLFSFHLKDLCSSMKTIGPCS